MPQAKAIKALYVFAILFQMVWRVAVPTFFLAFPGMFLGMLVYYFNIKYYDIPKGYLIPPVPSRLNYINFINILLNKFNIPKNEDILGIDIGTGANIIYPLIF